MFLKRYAGWWDRFGGTGPVYCVPAEVIEALSAPAVRGIEERRTVPPLISEEDAAAERTLLDVCWGFSTTTVGVMDGKPIDYQLLADTEPLDNRDGDMRAPAVARIVSSLNGQCAVEEAKARREAIRHQLVGYAGRLTFDPQYQGEKTALEARWKALDSPPALPFEAGGHVPPADPGYVDRAVSR